MFIQSYDYISADEINTKVADHALWLVNGGGECAVFSNVDLIGIDLRNTDLRYSRFMNVDLSSANLSNANLRGVNIHNADLTSTNLENADLSLSSLYDLRLFGTNMRNANLTNTFLSHANMVGTQLFNVNLSKAILDGVKICEVQGFCSLGNPNGWDAYMVLTDIGPKIKVGCRLFTLDEARKYWAGKADRREVLATVEYAEAVAKIRGWC